MKIIICGAGLSGRAIAEKLSQIGNEVTIIDSSKRLIEKLANKLDRLGKEYEWYVEPYEGHGFRGEQSTLNLFGIVEVFLDKHLN